MKIWKYNHFDAETRSIVSGEEPKTPLIISDNAPDVDYSEITDIHLIYPLQIGSDYLFKREAIKVTSGVQEGNWVNLSTEDKDILIELFAHQDDTEAVMHLMGKGLTQVEAQGYLIKKYAEHHVKEIEACRARAASEDIYVVIAKYLSFEDAGDFFKTIEGLYIKYVEQGIKGVNDGSSGEGLFDFVESTTGTVYETAGLEQQGYVLKFGDYNSFRTELMNILRHGYYGS